MDDWVFIVILLKWAIEVGCEVGVFPRSGLPLGNNPKQLTFWSHVEDRWGKGWP